MPPVADPVNGSSSVSGGTPKCSSRCVALLGESDDAEEMGAEEIAPTAELSIGGDIEGGAAKRVLSLERDHQLGSAGAHGLDLSAGQKVVLVESEDRHDLGCLMDPQELGPFLGHDDPERSIRLVDDVHVDDACLELDPDRRLRALEPDVTRLHQGVDRGDGRMTGQGNLLGRRKVAEAEVGFRRRAHERRLGKVHLQGEGLHDLDTQPVGVEDDGARVPLQRHGRERVDLSKR